MKAFFSEKKMWLAGAAAGLMLMASVGSTMAYFTAHTNAEGGYLIAVKPTTTEVDEDFYNAKKYVSVFNSGETPCFVRARVLSGTTVEIKYSAAQRSGSSWTEITDSKWSYDNTDGYWYYADLIAPGESTEQSLVAEITNLKDPDSTLSDFNVIIIQECTPVQYDAQGNAIADWNADLEATET